MVPQGTSAPATPNLHRLIKRSYSAAEPSICNISVPYGLAVSIRLVSQRNWPPRPRRFSITSKRCGSEAVFDVIENQPQRLTEVPGIRPKRIATITRVWAEQKLVREIMVPLQRPFTGLKMN